jgi:hypothetical protein
MMANDPLPTLRLLSLALEMIPTANAKQAFNELTRVWGARPKVFRHADDEERNFINIASLEGSPVAGVTAVGTVGLSDHDLGLGDVRVELVGAFPSTFAEGVNVAATCAFNAFKDGLTTRPDAIHPNVLNLYRDEAKLPHVLLVDPFLWQDGPSTFAADGANVAWLMMVPISEGERRFASEAGVGALTARFEEAQIDIFDLDRQEVA